MILLCMLLFSQVSISQKKIDLPPIPSKLQHKANAVYREYSTHVTVKSPTDIIVNRKIVLTVLNKKGEQHTQLVLTYGKFEKIISLSANLYNAFGKRSKKFSEKDFYDQSLSSGSTLFSDSRFKAFKASSTQFPYTVVYEYSKKYSSSLFLPQWDASPEAHVAYMNNNFTLRTKKDLDINIKEKNTKDLKKVSQEKNFTIRHWKASNITAQKREPLSLPNKDLYPHVLLALNNFIIDGYKGSFSSWKEFGKWSYTLNQDKDKLPEEAIQKVKEITKNLTSPKAKAKAIYEYMQNRTRYVNVAIGIGGWQPFSAETVHKNGYGDCKGLTNYTKSLLHAAGIPSHYTLIKAGTNIDNIDASFPSQQFNHAILCVPFAKDTVWLECTSQQSPFGFLSDHTSNRHALLIGKDGGKLVRTHEFTHKQNYSKLNAAVQLNANGSIAGEVTTRHHDIAYGDHMYLIHMKPSERKKHLIDRLDLPMLQIQDVTYTEEKEISPSMVEKIQFKSDKYATFSGKRMFVNINICNRVSYVPKRIRNRKTDFVYNNGLWDDDEVEISLPDGYTVEYCPQNKNIVNDFGHYKTSVSVTKNKVIYKREFVLKAGRHKAEKWNAFRSFFEQIKKEDASKIILTKKTL